MSYKLIKHLESSGYNRKLFYLDGGEEDLPQVSADNDIDAGSEAYSLFTGNKWILNTNYVWIPVIEASSNRVEDVPKYPLNVKYVRESHEDGGGWTVAKFTAEVAVNDFQPYKTYLKNELALNKGILYRAIETFVALSEFIESNWESLIPDNVVEDFKPLAIYIKNELILYLGIMYRAKTNFTATEVFVESNWELITVKSEASSTLKNFEPRKTYIKDEVILNLEKLYRAKATFTSGAAFVESDWELVTKEINTDTLIKDFQPNKKYLKDETIFYNERLYRALNDFIATTSFVESYWESIVPKVDSNTTLEDFKSNAAYVKNELICHLGVTYRAKAAFTSTTLFVSADWELITTESIVDDFKPLKVYGKNQLVLHLAVVYRAKTNFTSAAAFNEADWESITAKAEAKITAENFKPYKAYVRYELILNLGVMYRARVDFTAKATFDASDWESITTDTEMAVENFVPKKAYVKNELTMNSGTMYRAKADFIATESFVKTDWDSIITESNVILSEFVAGRLYHKDEMIFYNNFTYKAKEDFVATSTFDPTKWDEVSGEPIKTLSYNEWSALVEKPEFAYIIDSMFDI